MWHMPFFIILMGSRPHAELGGLERVFHGADVDHTMDQVIVRVCV